MAMVMVLWLIVLVSIIAGDHVLNTRAETRLAAHHVEQATARAVVAAGVNYAILQLLAETSDTPLHPDGTVYDWSYADRAVRYAVRDATGMIDVNHAGAESLQAVLAEIGVEPDRQDTIIGALLDWRDSDDRTQLHGAEDADYAALGYGWSARDGALLSVEEVRYLPGMTPVLFDDLAPFLTIYSGRSDVNLEFAAPLLVRAATGREISASPTNRIATRRSGTYHIYVDVPSEGRATASAEAVVQIGGSRDRPYTLVYWRDAMRKPFPDRDSEA